ncbi:MAG: HAMP domain-containing protein [bacterium]|nr:HAMP domain-containing protein [bacterium]
MQRRLFILFLLLSFVPAATILLVNWSMSQRHLGFLDSPGLRHTFESSLDLARRTVEREKSITHELALDLADEITADDTDLPSAAENCSYRFRDPVNHGSILGRGEVDPFADFAHLDPDTVSTPLLRDVGSGSAVLITVPLVWRGGATRLVFTRTLDPRLVAELDAVAAGGSRYRQLRLYYGDLVRGDTLVTLGLMGLVILALALWFSRRLARQISGPLQEIVRGTELVAQGDLNHRVDTLAHDEVADLMHAFNDMTERLRRGQIELLRAERVAAWQGIARRLAHEIKNPLTPINLAMHRIGRKSDDPVVTECVGAVLEETANLQRLADEFSLFARLPAPVPANLDLVELLHGVVELYIERSRVEVTWRDIPESLPLSGDQGQLRQVFSNLVKNASEAMAGRGHLTISCMENVDGLIAIRLQDSGPGLDRPAAELFEPYVTGKETGTGLGLAIARKVVEDHGGKLMADNAPEGGARFTVLLPGNRKQER